MLSQLFDQLPKTFVAIVGLVIGLLVITYLKPEHSPCDAQVELFQKSQSPFLYPDPKKKYATTPKIESAIANCRAANSAGGCLEYFAGLKALMNAYELAPKDCRSYIAGIPEAQGAVSGAIKLMVQLAWGEKMPQSPSERNGWLDSAHLYLFCRLQKAARLMVGDDKWNDFRSKTASSLPGTEGLAIQDFWKLTIFSTACE